MWQILLGTWVILLVAWVIVFIIAGISLLTHIKKERSERDESN